MNDQTVWKATSKAYPDSPCHFGDPATAKAWAGPGGTVEEITIKGKERTVARCPTEINSNGDTMKKVQVTYKDGEAFVVTKQRQAIVRCKATAELALEGEIRPNTVDMAALAAGYLELLKLVTANA